MLLLIFSYFADPDTALRSGWRFAQACVKDLLTCSSVQKAVCKEGNTLGSCPVASPQSQHRLDLDMDLETVKGSLASLAQTALNSDTVILS